MTTEELHKAFLEDLSALLKKYNATLETECITRGYHSYDVWIIEFQGQYEEGKERDYSSLDLPTYLD